MRKILSEEEINKIFELKKKVKEEASKESKALSLGNIEKLIREVVPDFSYDNQKRNQLIDIAFSCNGNLLNNPENLKCPKCLGRYIVELRDGDVYYRLFNGSEETKRRKREKFKNSPLFINRASIAGYYETSNICLQCGFEW